MAKYNHKNMAIKFGATTYNCVNTMSVDGATEESSIICSAASGNAVTHRLTGAASWQVTATVVTEDDVVTLETAFALGASDTLSVFPTGSAVGNKELAWSSASVSSNGFPMDVAGMGQLTITLLCDGDATIDLVTA